MKVRLQWLVLVCLALCTPFAQASFHEFRIEQVYSNADGTVQFVVMHEASGSDGENFWAGQQLRVTDTFGATRQITFPTNLPSSSTANARVLIATPGFAALGLVTSDFSIPAGFLPTGGGTLNYAGVNQITFAALPTDGVLALMASGGTTRNLATNFARASASVGAAPSIATGVEFYNASLDHYFISHIPGEIAILDAGVTIKGWARTGRSFNVYTAAGSGTSPVCRYYIPPEKGNSHFYGRGTAECDATGQKNPSFINEDPQFFHVVLPTAGVCPAGTIPVYRVFSNRPDANHRYTIDRATRDDMSNVAHWLIEGDGPDFVVMCVPGTGSDAASSSAPPIDPPVPADPGMPAAPDPTPRMCYPGYPSYPGCPGYPG